MRSTRRTLTTWLLSGLLSVGTLLGSPGAVLAQEEEEENLDARLEGYEKPVAVENDSTALTWLLFVFMSVLGLSVLFKNAKRTHLD